MVGSILAETFETTTGLRLSGEPVSFNEKGVVIRQDDGAYADRLDWGKFTQESLAKLAKNPKAASFAEPFLLPTEEELAAADKTALVIKTDYEKLDRPAPQGLIRSLFTTGIGWVAFLLIYGANIYAGYEISIFRARSPGMVCGMAAVLPILGPIIFLCMPTQVESKEEIVQEPAVEKEAYHVGQPPIQEAVAVAQTATPAAQHGATQSFPRGQFTFNRRFFESKFPSFFGVVRRAADKDKQLLFRTARGTFTADRITRVAASELYIETHETGSVQEVMLSYLEIQEVALKPKSA